MTSKTGPQLQAGQLEPATLARLLPYNLEAEQSIVGGLILYPDAYDDVSGEVAPDDFFDLANKTLFEAISAIRDANKPLDVTLLVASLKAQGAYEQIGGGGYLVFGR